MREPHRRLAHATLTPTMGFYLLLIAAYGVEWWLFRRQVLSDTPSLAGQLVKIVADGMLFFCLWWALPARWRWANVAILWCLSAFFVANLQYFRVYDDLMPFTSLFLWGNFGGLLFNSVKATWHASDWTFIALPALLTTLWAFKHRSFCRPSGRKLRWGVSIATVALFAAVQFNYARALRVRLSDDEGREASLAQAFRYKYIDDFEMAGGMLIFLPSNGLPVYMVKNAVTTLRASRRSITPLTPRERAEVERFIASRPAPPDSLKALFAANRDKNLIFIIVESLNSEAIGRTVDGVAVAPTLDSLLRLDGTVSALRLVSQVRSGGSSDGQLMYNTGLLPLAAPATVMAYGENAFRSLAMLPGLKASAEFIADKPLLWNHHTTTRSFGYDALHSEAELLDGVSEADVAALGMDRLIFDMALRGMARMPQPFLAEITTISMHLPCDEPAAEAVFDAAKGLSPLQRRYYTATRYFDRELARFLQSLKNCGLYDNSVVVIASDHCLAYSDMDHRDNAIPVAFIALNTGLTLSVDREAGQIDVFPTIVDIMGRTNVPWRGVGSTLFAEGPDAEGSDADRISSLIIRSDYFAAH